MSDPDIKISHHTYDELIAHLQVHAPTDSWAKSLLKQLQTEAKPCYLLESGSYLLDGRIDAEYRVN